MVVLTIVTVWFLLAIICVPALIGGKNPLPVTDYPLCFLSNEIGYVLYSTVGSLYVPCVILVFVYFIRFLSSPGAKKNINIKHIPKQIDTEVKDDLNSVCKSDVRAIFLSI